MNGPRWLTTPFLALAMLVATSQALPASDTTPAGNAPPLVILDQSSASGYIMRAQGLDSMVVPIRDSIDVLDLDSAPRDTIPAHSIVTFRWHSEPTANGSYAVAYRYKLDEPDFRTVSAKTTLARYDWTAPGDTLTPGTKVFTLRVVGNNEEEREITRRFQVGLAPETWIAGPDTSVLDTRFGWSPHDRHLDIGDWHALPDLSGTLLSCDSLTRLPADRAAHKTFFEIYGDRLFVRTENDTVHMNSWVVVHGGGTDLDSPYLVNVGFDPALRDTEACAAAGVPNVIRPAGVNGSPIGFRFSYGELFDPGASFFSSVQSELFPVFDAASVARYPAIAAYAPFSRSGKVYFVMRARDGDGDQDRRIPDAATARTIADDVDGGAGTPEEIALRSRILTFYVNRAPFLRFDDPAFAPHPDTEFPTRTLDLNLLAGDSDPYDLASPPPPGGPSPSGFLRWNVILRGTTSRGSDTTAAPLPEPSTLPHFAITVPDFLADAHVTIDVQLCDCDRCEFEPGSGRCVTYSIPVRVPSTITATQVSLIGADATPGLVRVRWNLGSDVTARVEKRTAETEWRDAGGVRADGTGLATFEDRSVVAGTRVAYRLAFSIAGREQRAGEVWVDVPRAAEFALEGVRPNPVVGDDFTVHFSLAGSDRARLEMIDLTGRRVMARDVGGLGPGRHAIRLGSGAHLAPGVYIVRLTAGPDVRVARAALVR